MALRFVSRGVIARRVRTLELVQAQARRAGIEVVPVYMSAGGHDRVLATGDFDVTLFAWFGPGGDRGDMDCCTAAADRRITSATASGS